jgi:hypothetical protein
MLVATAIVACCMLALPAAALAADEEIYRADFAISVNLAEPAPHWVGTVTGDVSGTVEFWESPDNRIVGKVMHFYESFRIKTSTGVIEGYDVGLWTFSTFKFHAEGFVTSATGDWAGLVGYKYHEMGYTSAFPPPEGGTSISGTGSLFIAAP